MFRLAIVFLYACTDSNDPWVMILPDSAPDSSPVSPSDARTCVPFDAGKSCCDLLPDDFEGYVACSAVPPGHCADLICKRADCTYLHTHVCTQSLDAGMED